MKKELNRALAKYLLAEGIAIAGRILNEYPRTLNSDMKRLVNEAIEDYLDEYFPKAGD